MLLETIKTVIRPFRKASPTTGLCSTVNVIRRSYEIGRQVADDFKATRPLLFDNLWPKWNYVATPQ